MLSIIIPVRNDAPALKTLVQELAAARRPEPLEILVVDGGSVDSPAAVLPPGVRLTVHKPASRGGQLCKGVGETRGDWLWFLHADTCNTGAALSFLQTLETPGWGRFDVILKVDDAQVGQKLRWVGWFMNWRSRLTGICTGDQGIFVHRTLLDRIGGVPDQPLMEDIELCRRLKTLCRPLCPAIALTADGRRWQRNGVVRTVLSMWWFRLRYWFGVDCRVLARDYYRD